MSVWSVIGIRLILRDATLIEERRSSALGALTSEDERQQLLAEAVTVEERIAQPTVRPCIGP